MTNEIGRITSVNFFTKSQSAHVSLRKAVRPLITDLKGHRRFFFRHLTHTTNIGFLSRWIYQLSTSDKTNIALVSKSLCVSSHSCLLTELSRATVAAGASRFNRAAGLQMSKNEWKHFGAWQERKEIFTNWHFLAMQFPCTLVQFEEWHTLLPFWCEMWGAARSMSFRWMAVKTQIPGVRTPPPLGIC